MPQTQTSERLGFKTEPTTEDGRALVVTVTGELDYELAAVICEARWSYLLSMYGATWLIVDLSTASVTCHRGVPNLPAAVTGALFSLRKHYVRKGYQLPIILAANADGEHVRQVLSLMGLDKACLRPCKTMEEACQVIP